MPSEIIVYAPIAMVRIAIQAAVPTCIISSNINAFDTSASISLIFVFPDI